MPNGLGISQFLLDNMVDLTARVTWGSGAANPGPTVEVSMTGDFSPGVSWLVHNAGIAFLSITDQGSSLLFKTWGTDTNGDYTARAIDIFTVPINTSGAFPQSLWNLPVSSPHGIFTYYFRPLPDNPYGFRLVAGKSALTPPTRLGIFDFYYDNRVSLRALVKWNPADPGPSIGANMTGMYSPGVTWEMHNGGVAFVNIIREENVRLRFETWGTDTNGHYTPDYIDIFYLPLNISGPFPQSLWHTQIPSPRMPGWVYTFDWLMREQNAFRLTGGPA